MYFFLSFLCFIGVAILHKVVFLGKKKEWKDGVVQISKNNLYKKKNLFYIIAYFLAYILHIVKFCLVYFVFVLI